MWLLLCLLCGPATAQTVFPPENARIFADGPDGVLFRWPGSPQARYFLQIYAGQIPAIEQEVQGNSVSVPLRAGLGYRWKVNLVEGAGYREIVPTRGFQVMAERQVVSQGSPGQQGGGQSRPVGFTGLDGGPGQAGYHLTATLEPVGDYVFVTITGMPALRHYYFAPGASPILLASRGGSGGAGGAGQPGQNGFINIVNGFLTLPTDGGDGGNGGDGGPGGTITVISNGLDVGSYLQFDVSGGNGGPPGPPGRGGREAEIPLNWRNTWQPNYTVGVNPARDGRGGVPGRQGPPGQVILR